ncbi:MAG TPA: FG-GAP-like repeat-containing protein [Bryobacteraceae bacterium]|nr:FG-GAP-like repeat-containing protein [Bryobacteraceae bacterium]
MSSDRRVYLAAGIAGLLLSAGYGANPSFLPDTVFKGSALTGWHVLGPAEWQAQNGEITGTAKSGGGWLVLDRSYQDIGVYASFRCAGPCKPGVLLRAEKTVGGMKGVLVSLADDDVASYRVTIDAQGKETSRDRLRYAGGQNRIAPPPDPNAGAGRGGAGAAAGRGRAALPANLPISPPTPGVRASEWNTAEILLDANIVRAFLNDSAEAAGGVADDDAGRYGPIALYIGAGEVHFKEVSYKDLGLKSLPAETVSSRFRMQRLNDHFYGWSQAAADVNRDGILDVIAGPYYYLGPDYTTYREIYAARTINPSNQYPNDCWVQLAADFNGDGWPDVLTTSHSGGAGAILYVNPKGELRRWDSYKVIPTIQTEITLLRDVDGDGKPELVYGAEGQVRYAKPDPANPTGPWIVKSVSERGMVTAHGLGVGDINGDGRMDILNGYGWWEQPAPGSNQELWTYHPQAFGRWSRSQPGGSVMAVYDVNGDGLNDVVTSLQAHGRGLAWFEQKRENGRITFVEHVIMDDYSTKNAGNVTFSQLHGSTFGDVDGDGIPDFIVGKRYWSHLDDYYDPDPYGAPVLYWYRTVRNPKAPGGAEFVPELIHNRSGAGSDVLAIDLNNDGALDIVTSTNRGTFIFWGKPKK